MPKSPKSDHNGSQTTRVGHSNIAYCVLLAALPVLAALLPQLWVFLLVPRDDIAEYLPAALSMHNALSPAVISRLYIYAIAASCTVVIAIASLWYSWTTLKETFSEKDGRLPRHIVVLLVLAFALACAAFYVDVIDDKTVHRLFDQSGVTKIQPTLIFGLMSPLPFNWDGRVLGFFVYLAFSVAAVTCAAAATTAPTHNTPRAAKSIPNGPAKRRVEIVRISLFLTTGVLLAAMVTAKLRFDVALATFGDLEAGVHHSYTMVAAAITSYWSVVLSLALAALYVPPTLALYPPYLWETRQDHLPWFSFNSENLMRVLRLVAIISPPLVAQVINGVAG